MLPLALLLLLLESFRIPREGKVCKPIADPFLNNWENLCQLEADLVFEGVSESEVLALEEAVSDSTLLKQPSRTPLGEGPSFFSSIFRVAESNIIKFKHWYHHGIVLEQMEKRGLYLQPKPRQRDWKGVLRLQQDEPSLPHFLPQCCQNPHCKYAY